MHPLHVTFISPRQTRQTHILRSMAGEMYKHFKHSEDVARVCKHRGTSSEQISKCIRKAPETVCFHVFLPFKHISLKSNAEDHIAFGMVYQNHVTTKVSDFKPKLNTASNSKTNSNFLNYNILAHIATLLFFVIWSKKCGTQFFLAV